MLNPQEKLKLLRTAEVSPKLAILQFMEMMTEDLTAMLSQKFDEIQKYEDKEHLAVSGQINDISDIVKNSIEEITRFVEDNEARMIQSVLEKIEVPTPVAGHTPTEEELIALITPLIKPGKDGTSIMSDEVRAMIKEMLPEAEKPMGEEELIALIQPILEKLNKNDSKEDSGMEERLRELEDQIKILAQLPRTAKSEKGKGRYLHGGGVGLIGSQEKSSIVPNGVLQTFTFSHTPALIYWNGQFQTLTDDYTVSGFSITFTGSLIPVAGDKIINIYA